MSCANLLKIKGVILGSGKRCSPAKYLIRNLKENDEMDVDVNILVDASTEAMRETQADLALTWSL